MKKRQLQNQNHPFWFGLHWGFSIQPKEPWKLLTKDTGPQSSNNQKVIYVCQGPFITEFWGDFSEWGGKQIEDKKTVHI